jgi:hypothetical protein
MTKEKEETKDAIMVFAFGLIIGLSIMASVVTIRDYYTAKNGGTDCGYVSCEYKLPSSDEISAFCQAKGFQGGWLSSQSCEGVQCYKEEGGGYVRYGCFKEMGK